MNSIFVFAKIHPCGTYILHGTRIISCIYFSIGSSGGNGAANNPGGVGGGILFLNISQRVTVNGDLLVNGENAKIAYAGGGSAGSIYIVTQRLDGSGKIQVKTWQTRDPVYLKFIVL